MPRAILILLLCLPASFLPAQQAGGQAAEAAKLRHELRQTYNGWRQAMIKRNANSWKRYTSSPRQTNVRNRLLSERKRFPEAIFRLPFIPPGLDTLKAVRITDLGRTAKAVYLGKIDFGAAKAPKDNLIVISYLQETGGWKYNGMEFINLDLLPEVRKDLIAGKLDYVQQADFAANGKVERAPRALKGSAPYIAKAYVFCPGREVKLLINKRSDHLFQNTKEAEIVIGGASLGRNEVQYAIKDLPGGNPTAFTIRVYLLSERPGQKPIKALEYQFKDSTKPKANGSLYFDLTKEMAKVLR